MKFYKFQYSIKDNKGLVTVKHGYFSSIEVFGYRIDLWTRKGAPIGYSYFIDYEDQKYNKMNVNADCDPVDCAPISEHRIAYCGCQQHDYVVIRAF